MAKARDPNSDWPEQPLDTEHVDDYLKDWMGPAGRGRNMKLSEVHPIRPPGAPHGDWVEGINEDVGHTLTALDQKESGRHWSKSTGHHDFTP
eukprot:jgi/Chrzof1/10776/Cz05g11230.t1